MGEDLLEAFVTAMTRFLFELLFVIENWTLQLKSHFVYFFKNEFSINHRVTPMCPPGASRLTALTN
ncbi:MAG TPA: hypothetical protein PK529_07625 [Verrucomicrobiales bacterium]|nr:hypothetical protein [Verrucomicrobiales bacterium]